jgi:hypothetical protein
LLVICIYGGCGRGTIAVGGDEHTARDVLGFYGVVDGGFEVGHVEV